jgi:hypothetical protein
LDGVEALSELWALCGRPGRAVRILGAAETQRDALDLKPSADEQELLVKVVERARDELGEDKFKAEWNAGRAMSLEEVIALALTTLSE